MRSVIVVLTVTAVVLLAVGPTALATATRTSLTFQADDVVFGAPERSWVSDGVFQFRGQPFHSQTQTTGDLVASVSGTTNGSFRLSTGDASFFGTAVIEAAGVTWEGTFRGRTTAEGAGIGTLVLQGSDGTKMRGTFEQAGPGSSVFTYEVVILDPKG
jgi:hypothetical protein